MNTRTRKALIVAAGLLFLGVSACTDTVVQPKSTITSANVFNDPNSYRAFLAKIYAGLAITGQQGGAGEPDIQGIDEGFSQYIRLYWQMEELPTDEAIIAWNDRSLSELNTQIWSPSNQFLGAMYYRIYYQVSLVNEFLRETTDAKLTERGVSNELRSQIQEYRLEARFLRALSYWHGLDLFGSIPIVTEDDPFGVTPPEQSTRQEVYDYVVGELNDIKDKLPAPSPDMYGRATSPAAHMLLAKVYMNAAVYTGTADYADAMTEIQAVINSGYYSLDPNYEHMFLADNNTSPEIIFAVTQDGQHTQAYGGTTFLVHASIGGSMVDTDYGISGAWWGVRLKPEAYNFYATTATHPAGDTRDSYFYTSGQTVAVTTISDFTNGIAAPKYQNVTSTGQAGSDATFVDTDYPMFRLGDAYLMYAEAFLRGGGGDQATALGYVNALRERAYGDTSGNITAADLTLPFILAERGRELLWEGQRRTDLIRFGEFTGGNYIWAWKGNVQAGQSTDSHLDLYPLPETELIANPNLTQNPGY
jgi:hypothetical protein